MKKIAVIGSRSYGHAAEVYAFIGAQPAGTVFLTGHAGGVCQFVREACTELGRPLRVFRPRRGARSRAEAIERIFERDRELVAAAAEVHAFYEQLTRGTEYEINAARALGVPVTEHVYSPLFSLASDSVNLL